MKQMVLVALLVAGCRPEQTPVSTGPQPTGQMAVTVEGKPDCSPLVPMASVENASAALPDGVTADAALSGFVQFLVSSGFDIESKDADAHVLVTRAKTGQTVLAACRPVNNYRVFQLRIAIVGRSAFVNIEVFCTTGWEAEPGVAAHRDPIQRCNLVSADDAEIPEHVLAGALATMNLGRGH